jgi:hypothetical protein
MIERERESVIEGVDRQEGWFVTPTRRRYRLSTVPTQRRNGRIRPSLGTTPLLHGGFSTLLRAEQTKGHGLGNPDGPLDPEYIVECRRCRRLLIGRVSNDNHGVVVRAMSTEYSRQQQ